MKYEVKMSCGHVETVELFGKTADRERKIAWLEKNGICEECKKAEREAADRAAAESAKENGWAELKGSEKQIAWAESIRAEKMAEMEKMPAANDQTNAIKEKIMETMAGINESRWWIDSRNDAAAALVKKVWGIANK